ncbi:hypothetical protein DVH24_017503 [Malus domestica]|uniref:Uncharacterized protein n=1 Tax=Malus domestica TaxID=3750 RepID=A0A498ITC7_MALDO|nr:hypothetical protein DVH24_017503 [Malus domestica]
MVGLYRGPDVVGIEQVWGRPLTWDPISRSHVGDPHIDNHVEPRGLTLHAGPRDPPSSRGAKGTHPSRGNTVRARSLALIPCRIIRETGHTAHFQQHRYCPHLTTCTIRQVWGFITKGLSISWSGIRVRTYHCLLSAAPYELSSLSSDVILQLVQLYLRKHYYN